MDAFEDENPFESDSDRLTSAQSSPSNVDLSEPPSPPPNPSGQLSPTSPNLSRPFPSPGSHRQPQTTFKSDFCCTRDRVLHSGDDVEILVCGYYVRPTAHVGLIDLLQDYGCAEDFRQCHLAIYRIRYSDWGKMLFLRQAPRTVLTSLQNAEARHRYSEFESLRLNLVKLYPTIIIPPIPSKQTLGDYAVKQAKAKEDAALISRRKRMLQTFLNRVAKHPILSNDHVFHRFLDGEVSWVPSFP